MPQQPRTTTDSKLNAFLDRQERKRLETFVGSLQVVLQSAEGRFVIGHWLRRAGIDQTAWASSGMEVHFNVAQQAFGFSMRADCLAADEDLVDTMTRELRAYERRLTTERDAREETTRAEREGTR